MGGRHPAVIPTPTQAPDKREVGGSNPPRPTFRNPLPRLAFRPSGASFQTLPPEIFRCWASLLVPEVPGRSFIPASVIASLMSSGPTSS